MHTQKRILAIHDISGVGKCSLTVALPIVSAAGIETSVLPTAILSTHTGGFTDFTFRDLTEDIMPIVRHWDSLNLAFNGIYTGFLGSYAQIDLISETFDILKSKDTLIIVDPVMADNGKIYTIFDEHFPQAMKSLCQKADIIIPNITEACLLVNQPYTEGPYTKKYIEELLMKLSALGPNKIVLTGVYFDNEQLGAVCYDSASMKTDYCFAEKIEGSYHGTGDVFGSALVGAVYNDKPLEEATQIAVDFTVGCIKTTKAAGTEKRYGVNFEAELPMFVKSLGLI